MLALLGDVCKVGDIRHIPHGDVPPCTACTTCPPEVLPKELRGQLAGALFDLGISSPQLDDPARGMRPEQSGPLDLRFDISLGAGVRNSGLGAWGSGLDGRV